MVSRWRLIVLVSVIASLFAATAIGLFWEHFVNGDDITTLLLDDEELWAGASNSGLLRVYNITDTTASFEKWTTEDGLPTNNIQALAKSRHYDRLNMEFYDIKWLGTDGYGLHGFEPDTGIIRYSFTAADSDLPSDNVQALNGSFGEDVIFIGTDQGPAYIYYGMFDDYTMDTWDSTDGLPSDNPNIVSIFIEGSGEMDRRIWMGSVGEGVIRTIPMAMDIQFEYWDTNNSELPSNNVNAVARATEPGLREIVFCGMEDYGLVGLWADDGPGGSAGTIAHFPAGDMSALGLRFNSIDGRAGLPSDRVLSLEFDDESNLWIGTDAGAAYWTLTGSSGSTISVIGEITQVVNDIEATGATMIPFDTKVYFGTVNRIWTRYFGTSGYLVGDFEYDDQLISNDITSVYGDPNGSYEEAWFGALGGVSWFDGVNWSNYFEADGLPSPTTSVVRPYGATTWIGTEAGLVGLDVGTGAMTVYTTPDIPDDHINDIYIDEATGIIWVVTNNGGFSFDGAPPFGPFLLGSELTSITIDGQGDIWLGSTGEGLYRGTSGAVQYTMADGLVSNNVTDVGSIGDDIIWVATDNGVSRFNSNTLTWTNYQSGTSGLRSDDVRCLSVNYLGARAPGYAFYPFTENVMFGTDDGVSRVFIYNDDAGNSYTYWDSFTPSATDPSSSILDGNVWASYSFPERLVGGGALPDEFEISWFGHDIGASLRVQGLPELMNGTEYVQVQEGNSFTLQVDFVDEELADPILRYAYLTDDLSNPFDNDFWLNSAGGDTWRTGNIALPRGRYFGYYYGVDDEGRTIAQYPSIATPGDNGYFDGVYVYDQFEDDNNCGEARIIPILDPGTGFPQYEDHSLIYDRLGPDQDWFSMPTLHGSWYYYFRTHHLSLDADTDIGVYSGTCPGASYLDGAQGNGGGAELWWECPADDDYFLMVTHGGWDGIYPVAIAHNYDISVVAYEVDDYEDDDVCSDAIPIEADCVGQYHTLAPHGDEDWLQFEALEGIRYRVFTYGIDDVITDTDVFVYSGSCGDLTLVDSDTQGGVGDNASVSFMCNESGTYYVQIALHNPGDIGSYYWVAVCSELWPMQGCDRGHRGYMDADGPLTDKVEWARSFGEYDLNDTVAIDQTARLFVTATDGTLYAVLPNGRLDWAYPSGIPTSLGPVIDHLGNVIMSLEDGSLMSITPDGLPNPDWVVNPLPLTGNSMEITALPTVGDDGWIYVPCEDGAVYPVAADTGGMGFSMQGAYGYPVVGSPAIDSDGNIYFTYGGAATYTAHCFRPDFSQRWAYSVPGAITTVSVTLSHDENQLYCGTEEGVLHGRSTSGPAIWTFATGGPIVGSPAVHPTAGTVYVPSMDGTLYSVDPVTQTANWQFDTDGPIVSSPVVDQAGRVYFGSDDGYFYCLNPNGTLLWSYDFGIPVDSSPSLDSYGFVYITVGHELFVFDEWVPDPRAPESTCDCPVKVTEPLIPVTFTSRDNKSGVKSIALWYRFSSGASWPLDFTDSQLAAYEETGVFDFVPTDGEGIYQFYTIAEDYVGNVEEAPATADCECLFNGAVPESSCISPEYDDAMPIPVSFVSEGVNGIFHTVLWFRFNGGAWTCSGQARQSTSGTIQFNVNRGDGVYDFRTVTRDNIGNQEAAPTGSDAPDSTTSYDTCRPVSSCWADDGGYITEAAIPVRFRSHDEFTGVASTTLYYRLAGGDWENSGLSMPGDEDTFAFDASGVGEGNLEFTTVAVDMAGNPELGPSSAKTSIIYDETAPQSACTLNRLTDSEIYLDYSAADNVSAIVEVQLWHRLSFEDWQLLPTRCSGPSGVFRFVPKRGDGTYEFYTVAIDAAGNVENASLLPDSLSVYFDVLAPSSLCMSPEITTTHQIQVSYQATELNNGLKSVKLFYRYEDGEWTDTGLTRSGAHGLFDVWLRVPLSYPDVDKRGRVVEGRYEFYTITEDHIGNIEDAPETADSITLLDTKPPSSWCESPDYVTGDSIEVSYQSFDGVTGVERVRLYWCYNGDEFEDSGMVISATEGTFTFDVPTAGDGEYSFYTQAIDVAGHRERIPDMSDTVSIVDRQAPVSECLCPTLTNETAVAVTFVAADERADPVLVYLWYTFNSSAPMDSGLSQTGNTGAFDFELTNGEGVYGFYTLCQDTAGNIEPVKTDEECFLLYDATAPISTCSSDIFANRSPLSIQFSAQDPDVGFDEDGCGVRGVKLLYRFRRYADLEPPDEWEDPGISMEIAAGTFSFWAREGEGFYDFISAADDWAGNVESERTEPDCSIIYDVSPPSSFCTGPDLVLDPRITIDFSVVEHTSGIDRTTLWYSYNEGPFLTTHITRTGQYGQISFRPRDGYGLYRFYTISTDNAGNVERPPLEPDCVTTYAANEPDIRLSHSVIDFGMVMPGNSGTVTVEVFNDGLLDLEVSSVAVDAMVPGFSIDAMFPMTIGPQMSSTFDVTFAPPFIGSFAAPATVTSNDPDEGTLVIDLIGSSEMSVSAPHIRVEPMNLDFGAVAIGQTDQMTFRVYNDRDPQGMGAVLYVYGLSQAGFGTAFEDGRPYSWYPRFVQMDSYITMTIEFTPDQARSYSTMFQIRSNDPNSPTPIQVSGTGVTGGGPTGGPDIDLSVNSIDFGQMVVNGYEGRELYVNNVGSGDLFVSRLEISGTPEGTFYETQHSPPGDWSFTVEPGGSQLVYLSFHPPSVGQFMHTLNIYSNDPAEPVVTVALLGEGTEGGPGGVGLEVSLATDKSIVKAGEELVLTFGIENESAEWPVDLLGAVILPDGTCLYYPGWSMDPQPVFVRLDPGASIGPMEIVRFRFGDFMPKGEYTFYVAAFNGNSCDMEIASNLASASWIFE
ncbi:choice-of-anchor D domain-containing protein [bacterium]|nr:choice-of-anchor D domain-containing protein [bacterium]